MKKQLLSFVFVGLLAAPLVAADGPKSVSPTVCRLANGDLLAVFSGDRDSHICP